MASAAAKKSAVSATAMMAQVAASASATDRHAAQDQLGLIRGVEGVKKEKPNRTTGSGLTGTRPAAALLAGVVYPTFVPGVAKRP